MDKNEERARQMYDRGESPYGWTEKEKIENTQRMVNGQGGMFDEDISAADAKDINEKYTLNKSTWDNERIEAEIRETEEYIYERREEQAYQDFLDAFLSHRGAERCEEKIAEIKKAIYKEFRWSSKESGETKGVRWKGHDWIESEIERINSLMYMLSTYRKNVEAYKIFYLPIGDSIDDNFLSKKRNAEINAGVESIWLKAVKPEQFMRSSIHSSQHILGADISINTVEKVYEEFVNVCLQVNKDKNLQGVYRYSAEKIVDKIKSAIWRAVCIQEREYQYRKSDEWYRFKNRLWTKTIPISDEVIFILQYYVCCYEVIKGNLYSGVDSVETIVKNGRNDERYPLDKLEEKFAGKIYPKQMFKDIRAGEECRAGVRTNILTLIFAFICAVGAGVCLKEYGQMDRILAMITVFSAMHVLVTTGTVASALFLKFRTINYIVSSISSGILCWRSFSFICDSAKKTVPLGLRYLFCLASVMLFYIIFGKCFLELKKATRKMKYDQSEEVGAWIVGHWLFNCITIIVYSILSRLWL